MEKLYLENCCEILDSLRIPITASDRKEGPYPYYGANGVQDYVSEYIFDDDLVLLAEDGGNFGSKDRPIAYRVSGKCWVNNHAHVLKPKAGFDVDYICYSLMFYDTEGLVNGATRQKLTQAAMRKMLISKRPLQNQQSIVERLNRVCRIKKLREEELGRLDDLIKARFVELFGNPVTNEKGWKRKRLGELSTKIGSGATPKGGRDSYGTEGISLIRSMNIHNGKFENKDLAYISNEQALKLDNVAVEEQDVLLNITGASVARCCIVPREVLPARVNQHVCIIRCRDYILPEYLSHLMIDDNYQDLLWSIAGSGATREAITKQQVENLQVIMPPDNLQKQFAAFAAQVDKSKFSPIALWGGIKMTNFDFLKTEEKFESFADAAITAEKILPIDVSASIINCRRAMEFAVKWMYSVDGSLIMPWDDKLVSLMSTEEFRDVVDDSLWVRMDFIRKMGNKVAHTGKKVTKDQALLCLENLFIFMDFISYCYGDEYIEKDFDPTLFEAKDTEPVVTEPIISEVDLEALIKENAALKEELTARREEQQQTYVPKPLDISEYKTRKIYIDSMLEDAGWIEGRNWINEVELQGMPNQSGVGFADYVLYGDDGRPLAVIEAKRTCVDVAKGRQQAKLYADLLEKKHGRRPVIFLTNGFETRIQDNLYPERRCSVIYSKRDLEKLFNLQSMRSSLSYVVVDKSIAGRYYQEAAIKAVCDSFGKKNRRKALLVMATGSGKTRTVIALVKVLQEQGWIRDVLFLADRNSLVTQAKRNFVNLLPDLSVTNLVEEKDNYTAHCVFSTYQTMMNCIDSVEDDQGKLFTCGHFDLIICDEAHRSIYNKYKDIFNYFDAPLVGLTATPKDEIDKNTYEIFELENGVPTYGYDLAQAVQDGYLVDFMSVETQLKFIEQGIIYDDLSEEDKQIYEDTFEDENGELPESIASSALNEWIFNEDTIREVLNILMEHGLRVDYGAKIGKTIIFAKNHNHAEKVLDVFNKEYPHLNGFAKVIDNYMTYAQSAIDEFSEPQKLPQIAISVDMLDTGIDVPEILNLVFFKKVMSKAKFWQMIGRGTRLCPGLINGEDKNKFYIFDFCGNFEFFRINKGKPTANMIALQGAIFNLEFQITYKLQDLKYQQEKRLKVYRDALVEHMTGKVQELNRENFAVRQHLKYVDLYASKDNYNAITYEDTLLVREELAPLIEPEPDDASALRFDALMYGIELAYLVGKKYTRARHDLITKVASIASVANIPDIMAQSELIDKILHTDYVENAGINEFEYIRENLRDLMKYLPKKKVRYDTDFDDQILSMDWKESELENDDLKNYKAKAEYYIRQHQDNIAIHKLKNNIPLTEIDVKVLEGILWSEVGTKEDYEAEYGSKPLGEFVREIVGLDMNAAKEAFADYLNDTSLDSRQIYFVNQIVEYIVHNGMMKDLSVLQEAPFNAMGSVVEVFTDLSVWMGIRSAIERVNANALAA